MQKLKKLFPLVGALLALAFVSCGSDSDDDSKTAGSISYATTTVSKTTDDAAFTNELTKTGDGTVSYTSSKETVATVNATTGEVTIVGAGETTITATVADSDTYTYATKTASYTLTITQPVTLKMGYVINSIPGQLCENSSACTKFERSNTNNASATQYLDTEEKYIPVWSVDKEIYYYVPDGCTPVMNEDSSQMFMYCSGLTSLDLSKFDTSNVTYMSGMFGECSGLTSLDVTGFDTSKVTSMSSMFYSCSKLTSLDLTGFDTSKVTSMSNMFSSCEELTTIYATDKFVTTNVKSGDYCFDHCVMLVGGAGTTFDSSRRSSEYARIDGGTDAPGYFTLRN